MPRPVVPILPLPAAAPPRPAGEARSAGVAAAGSVVAGRPRRAAGRGRLAAHVERGMLGEDDVRALGDEEAAVDGDARLAQLADLLEESLGGDQHAVAEDAPHPALPDPRGG